MRRNRAKEKSTFNIRDTVVHAVARRVILLFYLTGDSCLGKSNVVAYTLDLAAKLDGRVVSLQRLYISLVFGGVPVCRSRSRGLWPF